MADLPHSEPPRTETVLPLVEERLQIARQRQETGALRVRVEVQESTETVPNETLSEQFSVQRTPVGRTVAERQPPHQDGDDWVVPVYEEVAVVEMRLVLKEEIRISRRQERQTGEPQQVRLRREVAVLERQQPDGSWLREPEGVVPQGASPPPAG